MVKCIPEYIYFFTVFLKNRNISSEIKRSKVTDYAALKDSEYGSVHEILVKQKRKKRDFGTFLIYAQTPLSIAHTDGIPQH